jgi:hypothetical protein
LKITKLPRLLTISLLVLIPLAICAVGIWSLVQNRFSAPVSNPIALENQNAGATEWQSLNVDDYVQDAAEVAATRALQVDRSPADSGSGMGDGLNQVNGWTDPQQIKGYASAESINIGQSINFHVSAKVPLYDLTVYRVGWYGGNGATWKAGVTNLPGVDRGIPTANPTTGMIEANWPVSYTLQTDATFTSGVYIVWLTQPGQPEGPVSYIVFVIRDDARTSDILYQVPFSTYQAYNGWGGKSLYDYNSIGPRASIVSYDRPYDQNDGSGLFFSGDYNMIRWMEMMGYDITYASSRDVQTTPNLMNNHKVFLSNFHDEYWSWDMRNNLESWRDAGKDLLFFDSNNIYWQIRWQPSSTGVPNRQIVGYKDATTDPMASSGTPHLTTVLWRDPLVNRPENSALGVMFQDAMGFGEHHPWVVSNASHWIYEGTGLNNGDTIPMLVGYEFDRVFDNGLTPPNLEVISHSPIPEPYGSYSNASVYTAPVEQWSLTPRPTTGRICLTATGSGRLTHACSG